jgi:hypothetical protein
MWKIKIIIDRHKRVIEQPLMGTILEIIVIFTIAILSINYHLKITNQV